MLTVNVKSMTLVYIQSPLLYRVKALKIIFINMDVFKKLKYVILYVQ